MLLCPSMRPVFRACVSACKILTQIQSFSLPLVLTTPLTVGLMLGVYAMQVMFFFMSHFMIFQKRQILTFFDCLFSINRQQMMSVEYMNFIFLTTTHLLAINHGRYITMFYGPKRVHRFLPLILFSAFSL